MIPIKLTKTDYGQGWADGHKAAQEGGRMDEKSKEIQINNFTPGPWKITRERRKNMPEAVVYIHSDSLTPLHGSGVAKLGSGSISYANSNANARLIAAAPDMYELLKQAKEILFASNPKAEDMNDLWDKIQACLEAIK